MSHIQDNEYGAYRKWGAVGWGIMSAVAGVVIDKFGMAAAFVLHVCECHTTHTHTHTHSDTYTHTHAHACRQQSSAQHVLAGFVRGWYACCNACVCVCVCVCHGRSRSTVPRARLGASRAPRAAGAAGAGCCGSCCQPEGKDTL